MDYQLIDTHFSIETDLLQLHIEEAETKHFSCRGRAGDVTVFCPMGTRFGNAGFQKWFRQVIREVLRKQAKLLFPQRLALLAEKSGLTYRRLSIHSTSSKWGSYSSLGNLNLSLYLLLLPSRYVDYTMCHELCHSREMNHGPRFWALLDSLLDGEARQLSREMGRMVKAWYQSADARTLLMSNH